MICLWVQAIYNSPQLAKLYLRGENAANSSAERGGPDGPVPDAGGEHLRRVHKHDGHAGRAAELPHQAQGSLSHEISPIRMRTISGEKEVSVVFRIFFLFYDS